MIRFINAYTGQPASTGTTVYTCSANIAARVVKCTAVNDTTTTDSLTVHKVPSGGSSGDTNLVMNGQPIGPKESYPCPELVGQLLTAGDSIKMTAGTSDQISVALSVVEVTQS